MIKDPVTVKAKRPVNLDLRTFSYPPTAIVSILHRISGIILFLVLPFVMYLWQLSLASFSTFSDLQIMMHGFGTKMALWAFGSAMIYHGLAGVRHLLSDWDWGDRLPEARWTAYGVMGLSAILILFLGLLLW